MSTKILSVKNKKRITFEKKEKRGDEIAGFLVIMLMIILFLVASFRFLAIGKFIDDFFIFFLFGWTKYLVYLALIGYFLLLLLLKAFVRIRFSFFCLLLATFFVISWIIETFILINNGSLSWGFNNNLHLSFLKNRYHVWWNNTIINNYQGFFSPVSFASWNTNGIFPDHNVGGIISATLISLTSYGTFVFNCLAVFIVAAIIITTLFFHRPFIIFQPLKCISYFFVRAKKKPRNKHEKCNFSVNQSLLTAAQAVKPINSFVTMANADESNFKQTFIDKTPITPPVNEKTLNSSTPVADAFIASNDKQIVKPSYDPKNTLLTPFGFIKEVQKNLTNKEVLSITKSAAVVEPISVIKTTENNRDNIAAVTFSKNEQIFAKKINDDELNYPYKLPELKPHLIAPEILAKEQENAQLATANKNKIEKLFAEFDIQGVITNYYLGTTVAKYEITIQSGMRVSKITNLEDELKLALATKNIRIEAPIPGKSMVGIEVANRHILPITLYEHFQHFPEGNKEALLISIGKSSDGEYIFHSLANMPHLLIAGSTGAGKSVFVNTLLISLLLKYQPYEVKLILIDPKIVELVIYNELPHLLTPVINDVKKVPHILQQVIKEMMDRYHLLASAQCRNIDSYNQKQKLAASKLPYYVIVIDELADLMLEVGKEVEEKIMRITQMGRAAGIHIIVATQRPSTNIITGVIKNNIPSRISFKVTSWIDSKTIIDTSGAEKLLGKGDLLFLAPGLTSPMRVQAPWISESEVISLLTFIKKQNKANKIDS